jgi:hypothetical protein
MHARLHERVRKRKKKMPIWLLLLVNGSSILSLRFVSLSEWLCKFL